MTSVEDYHQAIKARLIADPLVVHFEIRRERRTVTDGHLRARLLLRNGDQLELSEYVRQRQGQIEIVTYSFLWADSGGALIRRWDNVPHFPHLPRAPHHMHDGRESNVMPGRPMSIIQVIDEISGHLSE